MGRRGRNVVLVRPILPGRQPTSGRIITIVEVLLKELGV